MTREEKEKGLPKPAIKACLYALLVLWAFGMGCQIGPLLSEVSIAPAAITPNGDSDSDYTILSYTLTRPATVSIIFTDDKGKDFFFRKEESRPAGTYTAAFYGNYAPDSPKGDRLVIPSGNYVFKVVATDGKETAQAQGTLQVMNADTNPPQVTEVTLLPNPFSPDGDAVEDETVIGYGLTKAALTTVYITDLEGRNLLLEQETEQSAALHSYRWNGTAGEVLLPDGTYTLHIKAKDKAGNVTDYTTPVTISGGGKPKLEIINARFYPTALPVGGILNVEIKVKNTGEATLKSLGPTPGTPYDTAYNFLRFKDDKGQPIYYERPGYWRVGIQWEQADQLYPIRWGWGDISLAPGEEATITGAIQLLGFQTREVHFWANVIQEGVGFPQAPVGRTKIIISY